MFSGFIKDIDGMGRVVIPKQFRKELGLTEENAKVEMFSDGKQIICRKATPVCVFCKAEDELVEFEEQYICKSCIGKLKAE